MSNISSINPNNSSGPYPVVLLFGPTGVGKTELLLSSFTRGYEVISADSMQVYRGLDIGTAKPGPEERLLIPHHLIDIREPFEQFHVGDFVHLADKLISDIISRGHIPVISGGTAYYFKHFLFGLPETGTPKPGVRDLLQRQLQEHGLRHMYCLLESCDPASAEKVSSSDAYRILRALEVFHSTGKPLSSCRVPDTVRSQIAPVVIGLNRSREELAERIRCRVKLMMNRGLYDEVRSLIRKGADCCWPGMRGIGYREFFELRETGELSLSCAADLIALRSIQYARQQLTFFRSLPGVKWFHPDQASEVRSAVPAP